MAIGCLGLVQRCLWLPNYSGRFGMTTARARCFERQHGENIAYRSFMSEADSARGVRSWRVIWRYLVSRPSIGRAETARNSRRRQAVQVGIHVMMIQYNLMVPFVKNDRILFCHTVSYLLYVSIP